MAGCYKDHPTTLIAKVKKDIEKAARDMDLMTAARLRDEIFKMQKELEGMKG